MFAFPHSLDPIARTVFNQSYSSDLHDYFQAADSEQILFCPIWH